MDPFFTDGTDRAASDALTISVAEVLAEITPTDPGAVPLTLRVAADGHLIAYTGGVGLKNAVTAWAGEGQGARSGHPERWRQNYFRSFVDEEAAERRFRDLIAKHGGPAEGADR